MAITTRRAVVALVLTCAIAFGSWAYRRAWTNRPSPAPEPAPIDWAALADKSRDLLDKKDFDALLELEEALKEPPRDSVGRRSFARAALNCARGREASGSGDPYPMLGAAFSALAGAPPPEGDALEVDLAHQFLRLNLLRKTKTLLDAAALGAKNYRMEAVHRLLAQTVVSDDSRSTFVADLGDHCLTSPSLTFELVKILEDDFYTDPVDLEPLASRIRSCRELDIQTPELFPLPAPTDDLQDTKPPTDDEEPASATAPQLRERAIAQLSALMADGAEQRFPFSDPRIASVFELVRGERPPHQSDATVTAHQTSRGFFVSWSYKAFFLPRDGSDLLPVGVYEPLVREIDVTGDGVPEAIVSSVQGSGQFLSAAIVDQQAAKLLWATETSGISRGRLSMVDLDVDNALEVLTVETADHLFADCGQCLTRLAFNLYDFDAESDTFKRVSTGITPGELASGVEADGTSGMSPQMRLAIERPAAEAALAGLEAPDVDWSTDEALPHMQVVFERFQTLIASMQFAEAAALVNRATNVLSRHTLSKAWQGRMMFLTLAEITALAALGQYDRAAGALNAIDVNVLRGDLPLLQMYAKLKARLQLNAGQLGDALTTIRSVPPSLQPALSGELAAYYRTVGQRDLAYRASVAAIPADPTARLASMAVAGLIAFDLGRTDEALDWLTRAIAAARISTSGSATETFTAAASVALRSGAIVEALRLLHQGVVSLQPESWARESPRVYEVWATAFEAQGHRRSAETMWRKAAAAARPGQTVASTADAGLSKLLWKEGRLDEARNRARRAFEASTFTRVAIGDEIDKLSLVTDLRGVADWYFTVLIESAAPAADILNAVETWRLRTTLDVLEAHTGQQPTAPKDLTATVIRQLRPDEAFVSFVVTSTRGIGIVIRGDDRTSRVVALDIKAEPAHALVTNISAGFALNDPSTVSAIRANHIPLSLRDALERAGNVLVEPLGIASFRTVLISADETLMGIPWPAVTVRNNALVETQSWISIPSLALSFAKRVATTARGSTRLLVSVSNPVEALETGHVDPALHNVRLPSLRGALAEVVSISKAFRNERVTFLVDPDAIASGNAPRGSLTAEPARFLTLAASSEIVHVAAHGLFAPSSPMDSVIFLAPSAMGRVVRARDFVDKDLGGVMVMVFAACQSGTIQSLTAAEPIGFLRGLLRSGVRDVVLASWQIDDTSSPQLFHDFYLRLAASSSVEDSLRAAQIAMRARRAHPFYWAGLAHYRGRWTSTE